ncbi:TetR/AcrR family transcriptional regulator [Ornithinibacillus salinisoli]|uniref:TetR/AcrR family transcriptional regulator n=1 Tax=Ornithinibacillus salinisoli TaxID=1848459 RepID=A0ABW4W1V9_9BACI
MSKKQLIMDKALELFAEQGFEATSVQQITDYCGISKGAFYLAFKSKDELIIALIDHFMEAITSDIDHVVKTKNNEELLFSFYYTIFNSFQQHSDFGKVLMKEQAHTFNEDFIIKIRYYNTLIEQMILSMLERLYGKEIEQTKYDLMYCVKSFMSTYSELFLFNGDPLEIKLDLLSQSLVEKTDILAKHAKNSFITSELLHDIRQPLNEEITQDQIIELLKQKIDEMDECIEKDSLILLKQHLMNPTFSPAIVKGLLENIRQHSHCKRISYLLRNYLKLKIRG